MKEEPQTPEGLANRLILAKSLIDQILSSDKYASYPTEISILQNFRDGKATIGDAIRALESISKAPTS